MTVFLLDEDSLEFPPPALAEPNGLLAVGGDLRPERLLRAYQMGIFPWYSKDDPLLWWSPNPRLVLFPDHLHISRRLRRTINSPTFSVTMDSAFNKVIQQCASVHEANHGATWITEEMLAAYCRLHEMGWGHSVEIWQDEELVGGLYGLAIGSCFFGESMFSKASNASKVALAHLAEHLKNCGFAMIDCQVTTPHLQGLGAVEISRRIFLKKLSENIKTAGRQSRWRVIKTGPACQEMAHQEYGAVPKAALSYSIEKT